MKLREFAEKISQVYSLPSDTATISTYVSSLKLAGFEVDIPKPFQSDALDVVLAAAKRRKVFAASQVRTASLQSRPISIPRARNSCPKCGAIMQIVKLSTKLDAEFCAGCLLTQPT